jgi:hypothetical protein
MSNIIQFPGQEGSIQLHGPIEKRRWLITIDGFLVPHLEVRHLDGDRLSLCLDDRFEIDCPKEEANMFVWMIANAMAISAGYSCFGEHAKPLNPFMRKVNQITGVFNGDPDQ